ncbi:MAG TPA: SBBP repeat-containing protein [Gemmataceae bacterium]|nr:SBBP repeat-containing protein [Gemmataceae bacterium]
MKPRISSCGGTSKRRIEKARLQLESLEPRQTISDTVLGAVLTGSLFPMRLPLSDDPLLYETRQVEISPPGTGRDRRLHLFQEEVPSLFKNYLPSNERWSSIVPTGSEGVYSSNSQPLPPMDLFPSHQETLRPYHGWSLPGIVYADPGQQLPGISSNGVVSRNEISISKPPAPVASFLSIRELPPDSSPPPGNPQPVSPAKSPLNRPFYFEKNQGQTDPRVGYMAHGSGYTLFLTPTEAVFRLPSLQSSTVSSAPPADPALHMQMVGANPNANGLGLEQQPGVVNYYRGNDPAHWQTQIPTFSQVSYQNIYAGIDLLYYANQGRLEYDFVVSPGVSPGNIRLNFAGADRMHVDGAGDLLMDVAGQEVSFQKPTFYQDINGFRQPVSGNYRLLDEPSSLPHQVACELGPYDTGRPLVIDPLFERYDRTFGGSQADEGHGLAVDFQGFSYVTGFTESDDFPGDPASRGGGRDAFVTKLSPDFSQFIFSTYLGGSDTDNGNAIAIDPFGRAYVTGNTQSMNFPTVNPLQGFSDLQGQQNAFITRFNPLGRIDFSTYFGGDNQDSGNGIAVNNAGIVFLTGSTSSSNFPVTRPFAFQPQLNGTQNAFVSKVDTDHSMVLYSTYLGGRDIDAGNGIAIDAQNNAYVVGTTTSTAFPTANPLQDQLNGPQDAFITKLDMQRPQLTFSTFLGGSDVDFGNGIALDSQNNAYVTGSTASSDFPIVGTPFQGKFGGNQDAFVTKIDRSGSAIVYSTFVGGSDLDIGYGIAVDRQGRAFITGSTMSQDFPLLNPLLQGFQGNQDAFVTKLDARGRGIYSTYVGDGNNDSGFSIALKTPPPGDAPQRGCGSTDEGIQGEVPCQEAESTGTTDEEGHSQVLLTEDASCPCQPTDGVGSRDPVTNVITITFTDNCYQFAIDYFPHWRTDEGSGDLDRVPAPDSPTVTFTYQATSSLTYYFTIVAHNECCISDVSIEIMVP